MGWLGTESPERIAARLTPEYAAFQEHVRAAEQAAQLYGADALVNQLDARGIRNVSVIKGPDGRLRAHATVFTTGVPGGSSPGQWLGEPVAIPAPVITMRAPPVEVAPAPPVYTVIPDAPRVAVEAAETARRLSPAYLEERLAEQAANPIVVPYRSDPAEAAIIARVMGEVIPALSETAPAPVPPAVTPQVSVTPLPVTQVSPEEEKPMSWLSSAIKSISGSGAVKAGLSATAASLMEARRDQPRPPGVDPSWTGQDWQGGPTIQNASLAGLIPTWGTIGNTIGKVATVLTAGTAANNVMEAWGQFGAAPALPGAVKPQSKNVRIRRCPKGYALAQDGNCYPKSMLPRGFRAWKPDPKPVVSRSDQKAIQRADRARDRLVKITKASGAWASRTRPHHHHDSKGRKK